MIDPSVSLTPKSFTPDKGDEDEEAREERVGQVRELWPLLLQCEQRRVMVTLSASTPTKAESDNQKQNERVVYLYRRRERSVEGEKIGEKGWIYCPCLGKRRRERDKGVLGITSSG